ncbi:MAG: CpsD/CapB family tyrosine-protein kinase [bacterium]
MLSSELSRIISTNQASLSSLEGDLLGTASGKPVKAILVTSCRPKEGKTTSAATMAHTLAAVAGKKVLLVDAHLSAPIIHDLFGVKKSPGLTDFLLSRAGEKDAIQSTEIERLKIMTCGTFSEDPVKIFHEGGFPAKLSLLCAQFDYVIFDTGSVMASSDVALMARHFDGVVFVAECEKTKWEILNLAKEKITKVNGKILGVILNKRQYYIPAGLYGKI